MPLAPVNKPSTIEEIEFFDKTKRVVGNKATYNEFLKVLNLFSQEVIGAKTLVERVTPFLSKAPELLQWFKSFVKYDEGATIQNTPADLPEVELRDCEKFAHSYRRLPRDYPRAPCSGRNHLCNEVLNDGFLCHPVYLSETGFVSHKKNIYEEAMHKTEEDRYEFDMTINTNLHTINLMEALIQRMADMTPDERSRFQLKDGLGGFSKTIYKRAIRRMYNKERSEEIIAALHRDPAVVAPVVLSRLKQKDEEWKRAQREYNKIWRDVDAKNYYKALDHQGIKFKQLDRKATSTKNLVAEIEMLTQNATAAASATAAFAAGPAGIARRRYDMDFVFRDPAIFGDIYRLFQLVAEDEEREIRNFFYTMVAPFFFLDTAIFEQSPGDGANDSGVTDVASQPATSATANGADGETDSASHPKDKDGKGTTTNGMSKHAPSSARGGSNVTATASNGTPSVGKTPVQRGSLVFYANTSLYVFFRLLQMLYARLYKIKELSAQIASTPQPEDEPPNPIAVSLGLVPPATSWWDEHNLTNGRTSRNMDGDAQGGSILSAAHVNPKTNRYRALLGLIGQFITNQMDSTEFEDRTRQLFKTSAYLMFTVDRLLANLVKQVLSITHDLRSQELIDLYHRDRMRPSRSSRQEIMLRLAAEEQITEDSYFRLEYFVGEKVLTFKYLQTSKLSETLQPDMAISSEERWSHYVDHYVQLGPTYASPTGGESVGTFNAKVRRPFLRRNLPANAGADDEAQRDIITHSGLELKICVNTYKIFFVDHTEDYFERRREDPLPYSAATRQAKQQRWRAHMDTKRRERRKDGGDWTAAKEAAFEQWFSGEEWGPGRAANVHAAVARPRADGAAPVRTWRVPNLLGWTKSGNTTPAPRDEPPAAAPLASAATVTAPAVVTATPAVPTTVPPAAVAVAAPEPPAAAAATATAPPAEAKQEIASPTAVAAVVAAAAPTAPATDAAATPSAVATRPVSAPSTGNAAPVPAPAPAATTAAPAPAPATAASGSDAPSVSRDAPEPAAAPPTVVKQEPSVPLPAVAITTAAAAPASAPVPTPASDAPAVSTTPASAAAPDTAAAPIAATSASPVPKTETESTGEAMETD